MAKEWEAPEDKETLDAIKARFAGPVNALLDEMDEIKDQIDTLAKEMQSAYDMPKSCFNWWAKTYHKADLDDQKETTDHRYRAYNKVMQDADVMNVNGNAEPDTSNWNYEDTDGVDE